MISFSLFQIGWWQAYWQSAHINQGSPTGWCCFRMPRFSLDCLMQSPRDLAASVPARVLRCPPEPGVTTISPCCIPICCRQRNYERSSWSVTGYPVWSCAASSPLPLSLCLLSVTAPSARLSPRCGTGYMEIRRNKTCLTRRRTCARYYGN